MIVVTGAAGFIGSAMIAKLNRSGYQNIIAVDHFDRDDKNANLTNLTISQFVNRDTFFQWLDNNHDAVRGVIHLGARTDTTEFNVAIFDKLNLNYSKQMWLSCTKYNIPLLYASSAATYGGGELGYSDNHEIVSSLKPLNPYGESKNNFDIWALEQTATPPFWAGFKFFNVYGPNEYHKGRMASVVFHSFNQIKSSGEVKLFRSHRPDFEDGMQLRDFVYVKDVTEVLFRMLETKKQSGIYNLGTGNARAFLHLSEATFAALNLRPNITFIDTPIDIRDKYQYFTEADMTKLHNLGLGIEFTSLEDGVLDYVRNYLVNHLYL